MRGTALDRLIEDFGRLPLGDREYAADLLRKQLIEAKREAIYKRAKSAFGKVYSLSFPTIISTSA